MPFRQVLVTVFRWFATADLLIMALGVVGVATFIDARSLTVGGVSALNPAVVWHKWDALWYERIALHGYAYDLGDIKGQAAAGYFPLYPLTVGWLLRLVPGASFFWTATAVSTLATFTAIVLAARYLTETIDETRRVLLVLLTSAGAFYLTIPYTEGLFLLLVVATMALSRRRQYLLAGVVAGLGAVTRVHGLALVAVPVIACLGDRGLRRRDRLIKATATALVFAVPVVIYMGMLARIQGSATAFVTRQSLWSNEWPLPLKAVWGLVRNPRWIHGWLHGGYWALYVGLLIRYRRRLPLGELLFCAGALLISTQQESFHGIYRYVTPLVPMTLAIASDRPDVRTRLVAINIAFAVLMILAFVTHNRLAV